MGVGLALTLIMRPTIRVRVRAAPRTTASDLTLTLTLTLTPTRLEPLRIPLPRTTALPGNATAARIATGLRLRWLLPPLRLALALAAHLALALAAHWRGGPVVVVTPWLRLG